MTTAIREMFRRVNEAQLERIRQLTSHEALPKAGEVLKKEEEFMYRDGPSIAVVVQPSHMDEKLGYRLKSATWILLEPLQNGGWWVSDFRCSGVQFWSGYIDDAQERWCEEIIETRDMILATGDEMGDEDEQWLHYLDSLLEKIEG